MMHTDQPPAAGLPLLRLLVPSAVERAALAAQALASNASPDGEEFILRLVRSGNLPANTLSYLHAQLLTLRLKQAGGGQRAAILRAVADKLGISEKVLRADARFAAAADALVAAHGELARRVIFGGAVRVSPRRVGEISRMAPPRQEAELASYARTGHAYAPEVGYADLVDRMVGVPGPDGTRRPVPVPDRDVPPLDTVCFAEVVSRLARAEGLVAKNVFEVPRLEGVRPTLQEKERLLGQLDRITRHAALLRSLILTLEPSSP